MNDAALYVYVYRSPFGTMTIRPDIRRPEDWLLIFEARELASNGRIVKRLTVVPKRWESAGAVADAVLLQRTGWDLWDSLPPVVFPASLADWTIVESPGATSTPPAAPGG
ncbi:conserved hypothetical protein [Paraburkholderia caribensis]|nr:conserved hypothetical protein [Paraburkholderia caribensis]